MADLHLTQCNMESRQDVALRQKYESEGFPEILLLWKNTTYLSGLEGNNWPGAI
jgi:hypothetical protein